MVFPVEAQLQKHYKDLSTTTEETIMCQYGTDDNGFKNINQRESLQRKGKYKSLLWARPGLKMVSLNWLDYNMLLQQ